MDYGTQQNEDIVVRILQKRPWNQDVQTDVFWILLVLNVVF